MKMSTYTRVPFCRCFGVPIVEQFKILAVCRVFVTARQTPQTPEKTLIPEKSADRRTTSLRALARAGQTAKTSDAWTIWDPATAATEVPQGREFGTSIGARQLRAAPPPPLDQFGFRSPS